METANKLCILACAFILIACASRKKAEYDFPPQMLPQAKAAFTERCDKGKVLYDLNCARCHNYKVKRREVIPDFRQEQLVGYTLRLTNKRHQANLTDTIVTTEELGYIMTFLTYKKRNETKKK